MGRLTDHQRNLHPHAEARLAMALWGYEYAHMQKGGSMDFWDSLDPSRQRLCVDLVDAIFKMADENGRAALDRGNEMDRTNDIPAGAIGETFTPLNELRFIRRRGTSTDPDILQQAWRGHTTGAIRWESVPVVLVDDDDEAERSPDVPI